MHRPHGFPSPPLAAALLAGAASHAPAQATHVVSPTGPSPDQGVYLMMPIMSPERGKRLFVAKGCVACHAINRVGGHDAPSLDGHTMQGVMSPFDFAARMWNHAPGMLIAQEEALGGQITFTGQELADLIAFVHDEPTQHGFTEADLTPEARAMMEHGHDDEAAPDAHAEEIGHGHDDDSHD